VFRKKNIHSPICDGRRLMGMSDWPARNLWANDWMGFWEEVRACHGPRAQIQHTLLIWARLTCQAKMYSPLFCFVLAALAISLLLLKKMLFLSWVSSKKIYFCLLALLMCRFQLLPLIPNPRPQNHWTATHTVHTATQIRTEQNRISLLQIFVFFKKNSNSSVAWCLEAWRESVSL